MFGYYTLKREQYLPGTPEDVFPFFAEARNLEQITPPFLNFTVVHADEMRMGALIEYRLRLHGAPVSWLTRIEEWDTDPTHPRFVDMQLTGPYRLWHHTHEFAPDGAGATIMRDTVRYALPLAPLSGLAHAFVRRDLDRIFAFRAAEVARRLD
jgi:ligand-binding SRPBCC domain-containing protein